MKLFILKQAPKNKTRNTKMMTTTTKERKDRSIANIEISFRNSYNKKRREEMKLETKEIK